MTKVLTMMPFLPFNVNPLFDFVDSLGFNIETFDINIPTRFDEPKIEKKLPKKAEPFFDVNELDNDDETELKSIL